MARNHSIIKNHCQFTCRRQDLSETPIITRIHSNQYVITGSPFTILIHCNPSSAISTNTQQNGFEYEVTSPRIGAHLINLSCNCFFSLKSTERLKILKFYGEGVCTSNETSSSSSSSSYFYGDGSPLIFEKVEVIPIMPLHFAHAKETKNSVGSFYYENLSQDAKVNLADFLDEDKIEKNYLVSNSNKDSSNRRNYNGVGTDNNEDDNISQILQAAECSSLTALWIIFIITTLTIFTLQAYIMYILRQNAKISYPKDERILYKVPDSPVM